MASAGRHNKRMPRRNIGCRCSRQQRAARADLIEYVGVRHDVAEPPNREFQLVAGLFCGLDHRAVSVGMGDDLPDTVRSLFGLDGDFQGLSRLLDCHLYFSTSLESTEKPPDPEDQGAGRENPRLRFGGRDLLCFR